MTRAADYSKSISAEFLAVKDRLEYFIDEKHPAENGRYREIVLMNYLNRVLPEGNKAGTGFVKNSEGELTKQIDIIIYKTNCPKLFKEGDLVVLMPEGVLGIVEVKSTATNSELYGTNGNSGAIKKAAENGKIIGSKDIFNGIFCYKAKIDFKGEFLNCNFRKALIDSEGYLNHIAFDSKYFMRFWKGGAPMNGNTPCFRFYDLSLRNVESSIGTEGGYAFGYFISNLLERVFSVSAPLTQQHLDFLYPLEGTKEKYKMKDKDVTMPDT